MFQKPLLTRVLEEARQIGDRSLASVGDHFELCLAKCRTSSQVIVKEIEIWSHVFSDDDYDDMKLS